MSAPVISPPAAPARRSVRVYAVLGPASYAAAGARLAALLFGIDAQGDSGGDGQRSFTVHETSGGIAYADHERLWRGAGPLPPDPERLARGFLEDANHRIAADRKLAELGWHALVPEDLRPRWIGAVTPAGMAEPDHLLVQFACHLPVDELHVARVEGASVDLRIGRAGRILSLATRWRPIAYELLSTPSDVQADARTESSAGRFDLAPPQPNRINPPAAPTAAAAPAPAGAGAHGHGGEPAGSAAEPPAEYIYALADENLPQRWLAPFRFSLAGHHGALAPASAHSLALDMLQRPGADGTELVAQVRGGSGQISCQWGYWSPSDFFEQGLRDAGTGLTAQLPPGAWQVALQVFDRATGASAQIERLALGARPAGAA